jgi:hypothetical protein
MATPSGGEQKEDKVRKKMNQLISTTSDRRSRGADVQSGDTQGLSNAEQANSESVEELAADGQSFEAAAVSGVEDADDPDVREVKTREVPQDDVPREYDEQSTATPHSSAVVTGVWWSQECGGRRLRRVCGVQYETHGLVVIYTRCRTMGVPRA